MMRRDARRAATMLGAALLLGGCATGHQHVVRDPSPQLFQVDEGLYRGGQPSEEGYRRLADRGIRTIVSLRALTRRQRQAERQLVASLGMRWVSLPMRMYWRPTDAQIETFLSTALDPDNQPVFIHCEKGQTRTGAIVAVYRIVKNGWRPREAYAEARALGLVGWNPFLRHLILHDASAEYPQTVALSVPAPSALQTQ